jgi:hypothetical protein
MHTSTIERIMRTSTRQLHREIQPSPFVVFAVVNLLRLSLPWRLPVDVFSLLILLFFRL